MDFQPTPIQEELRKLARKFAQNEILPHAEEDELKEHFRPEWIKKLGELGLTGIPVPEQYGGSGLGYQDYIVAIEEIAKASATYSISVAVTGLGQLILNLFGSEDQKKALLPELASGQAIASFCLSEPSSGSDAASLLTTAKKDGSEYVIDGTKLWVTQGDVAKYFFVMARTGGPGPKGISTFLVEADRKGVKPGKREHKMGLQSSHTMEMLFEKVRVPESNRIGAEGEGFRIALTALVSGRITIGATALGISEAALECALAHAKEREQFGKPIGQFQGVGFMLADMANRIDAARLLIQRAAWLKDQGKALTKEAAMAKITATDTAMEVTTDAVQVLGGSGYTREFPVERYMREAKVMQIVEGTNQIQRLVIAKSLMTGENPK